MVPVVFIYPSQYHLPLDTANVAPKDWAAGLPELVVCKLPSVKTPLPGLRTNGLIVQKLFSGVSITTSDAAKLADVKWFVLPLVSAPIPLASALVPVCLNSNLKPLFPYEPV